jgi:trehalose 6-phosphate phosphatase
LVSIFFVIGYARGRRGPPAGGDGLVMTAPTSTVRDLPDALPSVLPDDGRFVERLAGRRSVVFLDYDGVLTPIVNRPKDGVICDSMRDTVQALAQRCTVCVVSGRDRASGRS